MTEFRDPRIIDTSHYRWVQLLNIYFAHEPWDELAALAEASNLSREIVEDIFDGSLVPGREALDYLLSVLGSKDDLRTLILAEYDDEVMNPSQPGRPVNPPSGLDRLADAINNLADAIREATKTERPR